MNMIAKLNRQVKTGNGMKANHSSQLDPHYRPHMDVPWQLVTASPDMTDTRFNAHTGYPTGKSQFIRILRAK